MKADKPPRDTDLESGFEPLRTLFAVLTLLLGFLAAAQAETGIGTLEARARDGHPPRAAPVDPPHATSSSEHQPATENSHAH